MPGENIDAAAQSVVVLELLQRPEGLRSSQLHAMIKDVEVGRLMAAAESLQAAGVIRREGETLLATAALERLDVLGMVCI